MARYDTGGNSAGDAYAFLGPGVIPNYSTGKNVPGIAQSRRLKDKIKSNASEKKSLTSPLELFNTLAKLKKSVDRQAGKANPAGDAAPFEDLGDVAAQQLLQQAMGLFSNASLETYDPSGDVEAALQGIAQQYGAQIKGLQRANQEARSTTRSSSKEIRNMYAALKNSLQQDARNELGNAEELKNMMMSTGREGAEGVTRGAKDLLAQNAAVAQGLGNADLMERLNAPINEQAQRQSGAAITRAQQGADEAMAIGGTAVQGLRTQGSVASMEGTERAADLFEQLQSYVQANMDKANALRGERGAAQATARSQILSSAANNANEVSSQNNQNMWKAIMDIANLQQGGQENAYEQWLGQQKLMLDQQKLSQRGGGESPFPDSITTSSQIIGQTGGKAESVFADIVNVPEASENPSQMRNPAYVMRLINSKYPDLSATEKRNIMAATIRYFGG